MPEPKATAKSKKPRTIRPSVLDNAEMSAINRIGKILAEVDADARERIVGYFARSMSRDGSQAD